MVKAITPRVPTIGSETAVKDSAVRQALQLLIDTHNARNGTTDQRFVTESEMLAAIGRVAPAQSSSGATSGVTDASIDDQINALRDQTGTLQTSVTQLQTTIAELRQHSTLDGYDLGSGAGQVPLNNGTLNAGLNAALLDGKAAGYASGEIPISDATLCADLNADMLDGMHAGHAAGEVPVSDGALCDTLNADLLDGKHASEFVLVGSVVTATKTATGKYMEVTLDGDVYYIPLFQ